METAETVEILVSRVALGDRGAFALLYQRTSAKLFGVCLRILKDRAEAEEALQESYVKIWQNSGQYSQSRASAISWLAAIARNQSIDRLRKRRAAGETLDAVAALSGERRRLQDCLQELDPKHAAAIWEAYFGGFTYEELARRGGMPLGTMKSWIRRSLVRLKDCLER